MPYLVLLFLLLQGPEPAIRQVLAQQMADWNRGDVRAFMRGYEDSPTILFVGTAGVARGHRQVLQGYLARYAGREQMGKLAFTDLEVQALSPDYASVLGRWQLRRRAQHGGDVGGVFTLLFRRTDAGWKIVQDHTSVVK